jgi:hypothetical protein
MAARAPLAPILAQAPAPGGAAAGAKTIEQI